MTLRFASPIVLACALAAAGLAGAAQAQTLPAPENVVHLSASATVERPQDQLTVVLSTRREGPEAQAVQRQVQQALDAALALARPAVRPGQVEVHTGAFSLSPRYAPKGGTNGWVGSAELVIEGRDTAAVAALAGRIDTLTVSGVSWSLSREQREAVEDEVASSAVARFRAKADRLAKDFGFTGWLMREVSVDGASSGPMPVRPQLKTLRMSADGADESLPVEAGQASVTVTVNGSVQLTR